MRQKKKTLVFLGDSITDCGRSEASGNDQDRLGHLGHGYVRMVASRLSDAHVINLGYNGLTSSGVLRQWRRFQKTTDLVPDLVSVLVGVNDASVVMTTGLALERALAYYEEDLRALAQEITAPGSQLLLIEPFLFPRPAEYLTWQPCVECFAKIVRETAREAGCQWIAPAKHFARAAAASPLGQDAVTTDGIHLTPAGQKILAELVLNATIWPD